MDSNSEVVTLVALVAWALMFWAVLLLAQGVGVWVPGV
jgi:hypothetical protein